MLFLSESIAIAVLVLWAMFYAHARTRDPFHPMIYLGGLLLFLYAGMPLYLEFTDSARLRWFLNEGQLEYVQGLNLGGVASLTFGVLVGGGRTRYGAPRPRLASPQARSRLLLAARTLALLGLLSFAIKVSSAGGFYGAYGRAYGGGTAASGYVREAFMFGLPALLMMIYARLGRKMNAVDWAWIAASAAPLLIHGLLGARRGPTFMVIVALLVGWYLLRSRRPALNAVFVGGLALGVLLLFLVANRDAIYLRSESELGRSPLETIRATASNEFIYGGGTILNADARDTYWWGRRYFVILFVRPIPRQLWPTKYADAAELFDIPNLDEGNLGTGGGAFQSTLGWTGPVGAAPGLIADMWIEFWVGMFGVLFALGWMFGRVWRKAVAQGGFWTLLYPLITALSAYLVMQTLEAFAFRALLLGAALLVGWKYALGGTRPGYS